MFTKHCPNFLNNLIADFIAHKKDPTQIQTDRLIDVLASPMISRAGNNCLKIVFTTEYRVFTFYAVVNSRQYRKFVEIQNDIDTVTYQKKGDFYNVLGYNNKPDEIKSKH